MSVFGIAEFLEQFLLDPRPARKRARAHREKSLGLIAQPAYCDAMQDAAG